MRALLFSSVAALLLRQKRAWLRPSCARRLLPSSLYSLNGSQITDWLDSLSERESCLGYKSGLKVNVSESWTIGRRVSRYSSNSHLSQYTSSKGRFSKKKQMLRLRDVVGVKYLRCMLNKHNGGHIWHTDPLICLRCFLCVFEL